MRDIPEYFLAAVAADAPLRALLGIGTDGDPRIYLYYSDEALIDEENGKRSYITYALVGSATESGGVKEPVYSFVIWARDMDVVEQVRDRLVTLFNKKGLSTGTSRALYGRLVHENDSFQEQPNFAGKTLHFKFGFLSLSAVS